jgi:hypothetical protein
MASPDQVFIPPTFFTSMPMIIIMKTTVCLFILCLLLMAPVSAYKLFMDTPAEINVGQTLKVIGNSSLPAGTSFDLVMYYAQYTATEIERRTVTLQDYNNKTFVIPFSTRGLKAGLYRIEVQSDSGIEDRLSSDSVVQRLVNVVDRSREITISSPLTQDIRDALMVQGSIAKLGNDGVELEVRGPEGPVFGPTWIETKKEMKLGAGEFTRTITVNIPGEYDVQFSDAKGYIGVVTFHVNAPAPTPAPAKTVPFTQPTTRKPTTTPSPTPTPTKSPLSPAPLLIAVSLIGYVSVVAAGKKKD